MQSSELFNINIFFLLTTHIHFHIAPFFKSLIPATFSAKDF